MVSSYFRSIFLISICMICQAGLAAELPDLITRLEKLDGKNSVSLAVRVKDERSRKEDLEGAKPIEEGDFSISADARAVTVAVAGQVPDTRVFREFSLLRANTLAHYAPQLVRDLEGLKLVGNRPMTFQGVLCQHWRLRTEAEQSQFGVKATTVRDVELWLDAQGYPLQALFKTQVKGKMFLFKFNSESTRQQRFKRAGGRLILVFDENKSDTKSKAGAEKRTVTTTVEITEG